MIDGAQEFYAPDEGVGRPNINLRYLLTQVVFERDVSSARQQAKAPVRSIEDRLQSLSSEQVLEYTDLVFSRLLNNFNEWKTEQTDRALDSLRKLPFYRLNDTEKITLFDRYHEKIKDLTPDYDYLTSVAYLMKAGEILFKDYPEERKQILNTTFEVLAVAYQSSAYKNKNKYKNTDGGAAAAYIRIHNPFKTPDISEVVQEEPHDRIVEVEEYATDLDWFTYSELSSMINELKKASGKESVISPNTVQHAAQTVLEVLRLIEGEEINESKYLLTQRARGGRRHRLPHVSRKLIEYIIRLPTLNEPPEGWVGVQELIAEIGKSKAIYERIKSNLEPSVKEALTKKYPQFANDEAKLNLVILWERMQNPEFGQYGEFKNPFTSKIAMYLSPQAKQTILSSLD